MIEFDFKNETSVAKFENDVHNIIEFDSSLLLTPTSPSTSFSPKISQRSKDLSTWIPMSSYASATMDDCNVENMDLPGLHPFVDTPPNSTASILTPLTANDLTKDDFFNFEPAYIKQLQAYYYSDNEISKTMDNEFMNYDDINCQTKSICASPNIDPWMCSSLQGFTTTQPLNMSYNLPPINTITEQYHSKHMASNYNTHDVNVPENVFDTASKDELEENVNNFDYNVSIPIKPNRECKNFWLFDTLEQPESPTDNTYDDKQPIQTDIAENVDLHKGETTSNEGGTNLQCKWKDCFRVFEDQPSLVDHIEKIHVEGKKGEDFSCFWLECSRKHKPFNARYKLLIHMRVHSGEKPNKCQVRYIRKTLDAGHIPTLGKFSPRYCSMFE